MKHNLCTVEAVDSHMVQSFGEHNLAVSVIDQQGHNVSIQQPFHAIKLATYDMILGFPWLVEVNPLIDWQNSEFLLWNDSPESKFEKISAEEAMGEILTRAKANLVTIIPVQSEIKM